MVTDMVAESFSCMCCRAVLRSGERFEYGLANFIFLKISASPAVSQRFRRSRNRFRKFFGFSNPEITDLPYTFLPGIGSLDLVHGQKMVMNLPELALMLYMSTMYTL